MYYCLQSPQFFFSFLASLNLPAALEDLSGEQVPKSVLEKAASVREKGGLGALDHQLQALPDLLDRNREILDEVSLKTREFHSY